MRPRIITRYLDKHIGLNRVKQLYSLMYLQIVNKLLTIIIAILTHHEFWQLAIKQLAQQFIYQTLICRFQVVLQQN